MGMRSGTNPNRLAGLLLLWSLLGAARVAAQAVVPLLAPAGLAFDANGGIYVAEAGRHVVDRFDPTTGKFTVIAGNGTEGFSGDGGPATSAELDTPQGLVLDPSGNLYIADTHNHRIRRVDAATGTITTIAGSGKSGFGGDGGPAIAAMLSGPAAVALDTKDGLLIADAGNHRIRSVVLATGDIETYAGNGVEGDSGDGGAALEASLDSPGGLAVDAAGGVLIADTRNHRVRRVFNGVIQAVAAGVGLPKGLSTDTAGNIYVADAAGHRILKIASGTASISAGTGAEGFAGDNGQATAAMLDGPRVAGVSPDGRLTLADTRNQRVRQVDEAGVIRTLAGVGRGNLILSGPSVVQYGAPAQMLAQAAGTGSVVFYDVTHGTPVALGTASLSSGMAIFSTSSLSAGVYRLMAASAGGESGVAQLTVTPAPVVAAASPVTVSYGQPIPVITGTLSGILARDTATVSVVFGTSAQALSPAGSYPVTATLTGTAAANYTVTATGTVAITQAATLTTLSSTAGTVVTGTPVGLTAKVASTTQGLPTGTVSFLDGGVALQTMALDASGTATMSALLGVGTHTVTAAYRGDSNFLGSTSTGLSEVITPVPVLPADFALNPTGSSTQTVVGGASAAFSFGVAVSNGSLSGPILLSATGLPTGATASFNPALIPPGGAVTTFTLTVLTVKPAAMTPIHAACVLLAALLLLSTRRRNLRLLLLLGLLTGCGDRIASLGGSGTGTGPVSYPITVTGTSTTPSGTVLQHTAVVTLVIQ